jgi:hypothetical protein
MVALHPACIRDRGLTIEYILPCSQKASECPWENILIIHLVYAGHVKEDIRICMTQARCQRDPEPIRKTGEIRNNNMIRSHAMP